MFEGRIIKQLEKHNKIYSAEVIYSNTLMISYNNQI